MAMKLIRNNDVKGESETPECDFVHSDNEPYSDGVKDSYEMLNRKIMAYER